LPAKLLFAKYVQSLVEAITNVWSLGAHDKVKKH